MIYRLLFLFVYGIITTSSIIDAQSLLNQSDLDKRVRSFLDIQANQWSDMNVPAVDGQVLYDLIIENKYTNALEIGTSTGHASIWMAWALSKTGGKLTTIEINEWRRAQALKNFKEAGLENYIDARLADAHELVHQLTGPFDFVFSDADKNWYQKYFSAIDPKLKLNGCYTSHNVSKKNNSRWSANYLDFLKNQVHYKTEINDKGAGMSISYKIAEK